MLSSEGVALVKRTKCDGTHTIKADITCTSCYKMPSLVSYTIIKEIIENASSLKVYYRPQRINVFTGVCDSVNRGGVCLVPGVSAPRGVPGPRGSAPGGVPGGDPPGWPLLGAVRILLECILVYNAMDVFWFDLTLYLLMDFIAGSFRVSLFIEWGSVENFGETFWLFYHN